MQLETVSCNLCGDDNTTLITVKGDEEYDDSPTRFRLVRCRTCGLAYINPRPDKHSIANFYHDDYGFYQIPGVLSTSNVVNSSVQTLVYQKLKAVLKKIGTLMLLNPPATLLLEKFGYRRELPTPAVYRRYPYLDDLVPTSILDIGCGTGCSVYPCLDSSLYDLKARGWEVTGVETDARAAALGNDLGLNIWQGYTDNAPFPPDQFGVIRLSHALEHTQCPLHTLSNAVRWLRPGGRLIVTVPNLDTVLYKVVGYHCLVLQRDFCG